MNGFLVGLLKGEHWWVRWLVGAVVVSFMAGNTWMGIKSEIAIQRTKNVEQDKKIDMIMQIKDDVAEIKGFLRRR